MTQLETERLILRKEPTTEASIEELREDYEKYVTEFEESDFPFEDYKEERTFLFLRAKRDSRFGYYNLFLKGEESLSGWCNLGLRFCEPEVASLINPLGNHANQYSSLEIEIGWAVYKSRRGKGYATEAAKTLVRYVFEEFHVRRIVAFTESANVASVRVMEKLGMKPIISFGDGEVVGIIENSSAT